MDDKYAASDKSKAARRQRNERLKQRGELQQSVVDIGAFSFDANNSDLYIITQNRLRRVPNALYENWVVRKTRLLSRQRKVARDIFKSIENGSFPQKPHKALFLICF